MIRYIIEEISLNGTRDQRIEEYKKDEIVLGRGTNSDVLLQSHYVSLNHAKLGVADGGFYVQDLASISGVQVNDKVVSRETLKVGDKIKLGDVVLEVFQDEGSWGVVERRKEGANEDIDTRVTRNLRAISLEGSLLNYKTLSIFFLLVILCGFILFPVIFGNKNSWSSGPMASSHQLVGHDCESCHSGPFKRVEDSRCLACHTMSEHAEAFATKEVHLDIPCASCHMEHNDTQGLISSDPRLCIACHADIKKIYPEASRENIPNFAEHTQFFVRLQSPRPNEEGPRVSLDNPKALRDNSNIKLNHSVHLKEGIDSPKGPVTLACGDCHEMKDDFKNIKPINFEHHCETCHTLNFDERLASKQVPHGDPDVVYKYLYAEYAKLFLAAEDDTALQAKFNIRRRPGESALESGPSSSADFTRAFVEKESRTAERQLFTKTACHLCHRVTDLVDSKALSEREAQAQARSRFSILKPQIPERWMPAARFGHGAHEEIKCEECHGGVRESKLTVQVLMPKIETCKECHNSHQESGKIKSDCIMCHSMHEQLGVEMERKRAIKELKD